MCCVGRYGVWSKIFLLNVVRVSVMLHCDVTEAPLPLSSCRLANITASSLSLTCQRPDVAAAGTTLYRAEVRPNHDTQLSKLLIYSSKLSSIFPSEYSSHFATKQQFY